jgi:CRP/FNR family transcriptional regulator, nitrogen oxide reductase regulator
MAGDPRAILIASDLFTGLEPAAAEEVLAAATPRQVPRGAALFRQGEPVEALYLIERGRLKLSQVNADGEEVTVRTFGPGAIVAGVALFDRRNFPVTATALTVCRVLAWPRQRIAELAGRHPQLRLNVMRTIADRMQDSFSKIHELATESVPQRVARALLRLAREQGRRTADGILIEPPLGRQELADLAGTTMFTASRLVASWARDGILAVGRRRFVVRSLPRLAALAGDSSRG